MNCLTNVRYLLYRGNDHWLADELLYEGETLKECIDFATRTPSDFMMVIDRWAPASPYYLDPKDSFRPYTDLSVLNEDDFPLLKELKDKLIVADLLI